MARMKKSPLRVMMGLAPTWNLGGCPGTLASSPPLHGRNPGSPQQYRRNQGDRRGCRLDARSCEVGTGGYATGAKLIEEPAWGAGDGVTRCADRSHPARFPE